MLHISINPAIFTKAPWDKLPEAQRRTYEYVIEHTASAATQAHLFPTQDSGLINGEQYVQGQSTTRAIAVGVNGVFLDEDTLKHVFFNSEDGAGTLQNALAYGVQRGILIVKSAAGVELTADDIFKTAF